MQSILIPTDFSSNAFNALQYAFAFADRMKVQLTILHIYEETTAKEAIYKKMQLLQEAFAEDYAEVVVVLQAMEGDFLTVLKDLLTSQSYQYVVMGMKGKSMLEQIFIGSNTLNVLDTVQTPVLVVPQKAKFNTLQAVSLAIDTRNNYHFTTFNGLRKLLIQFQSSLQILTVRMREEIESTEVDKLQLLKVRQWLGEEVSASLQTVVADSVSEGLLYYLAQHSDNDLLVMVARKRNFFEKIFRTSFTQQMAFVAEVPILIVYEGV